MKTKSKVDQKAMEKIRQFRRLGPYADDAYYWIKTGKTPPISQIEVVPPINQIEVMFPISQNGVMK